MPVTDYESFLTSLKSQKFKTFRGGQGPVLVSYAASFQDKPDIAIELPTGGGKTLLALLISEAWRRDGKKAAILSANKTLARQMSREAEALGIPAVMLEGRGPEIPAAHRRSYQRGQSVAIMNYWVYFNQKPAIDPADILLMDDAHLAEHCLHSLYSVEIKRNDHPSLFKALVAELLLRYPEYSILADAAEEEPNPSNNRTELLSFVDQMEVSGRVREIIDASPDLESDNDLSFRWARLRNSFPQAHFYLGLNILWLRPYIYPLVANEYYEKSQQRIYLSATIGDPGDLSRRLGTKKIEKIPVAPEFAERTCGRRLIVMNRLADEDLPKRLQQAILACLRILPKSVWLCSSDTEARKFQTIVGQWLNANGFVGHPSWVLTPLGDEIEKFKVATAGHLFVAGRFDGMDFKGNECRLVVVTTLPRAINPQEEFISAYLRDSGFMLRRLNARIVQALGRCNRDENDYAVYVLGDKRFVTHLGPDANKESIPRNIVAEVDMAQDQAESNETDLVASIERFLKEDFANYDAAYKKYLASAPSFNQSEVENDTATEEVTGWTAMFHSHNYQIAVDRFEKCWDSARAKNLIESGALHGWHWAKALYLQGTIEKREDALARALAVAEQAVDRGGRSSWFNRMRTSINRKKKTPDANRQITTEDYADVLLQSFDQLLEGLGTSGSKFETWCQTVENGLQSASHKQFHSGLEQLGKILGYYSYRPKHDAATDCRWRGIFGNSREVITFEGKIEDQEQSEVTPTDMGQAHNQLARARAEFEAKGYSVRGTIVTHLTKIHAEAEASAGPIKIVEKAAIVALWTTTKATLGAYRNEWSLSNMGARRTAAAALRAKLPRTGWLIRALDAVDTFITTDVLLTEWKLH